MRIASDLEKKEYLRALRQNVGAWSDFGNERFSGVVWGNFFYLTHHTAWEWDRRVNSVKNRAVGFVASSEGGCAVEFLVFRGYTDPVSLVLMYLLSLLVPWFRGYDLTEPLWHGVVVAVVLIAAFGSWMQALVLERGQIGWETLMDLLYDPQLIYDKKE